MDCNNSGVTAINTFVAGSSFSITPPRDKWTMKKYTAIKVSLLFYHHHHWQWMRRALAEYNKLLRILLSSGTRDVLWRLRCRICIYDEWGRSWPIEAGSWLCRYLHKICQAALICHNVNCVGSQWIGNCVIDLFIGLSSTSLWYPWTLYLMKKYISNIQLRMSNEPNLHSAVGFDLCWFLQVE